MPQYRYKCREGHEQTVTHSMVAEPIVLCGECGAVMWRVPQAPLIVWNGLPPHMEHYIGPAAKELNNPNEQARLQDVYAAKKAARGEEYSPA